MVSASKGSPSTLHILWGTGESASIMWNEAWGADVVVKMPKLELPVVVLISDLERSSKGHSSSMYKISSNLACICLLTTEDNR